MKSNPSTLEPEPFPKPASKVKKQIFSSLYWNAVGRTLQQIAQFGLSVILARLLSPEEFGIVAMASVFTGFATMLSDAGFCTALIQRQNIEDDHLNSVFWVNLTSNVVLTILLFLVAPWLAVFYQEPTLTLIFRIVGFNFLIGGFATVNAALLQKAMNFKSIAKIGTTSVVISGLVGVLLAFAGAGVWSLIIQGITSTFVSTFLRLKHCLWRPKMEFSGRALKELFRFASHLYGFNLMNYWSRNGDNLLIGKYFGASALGSYSRAYMLMLLPITQISSIATTVLFPAFASIQNDKDLVRKIYLRAIGILTLVTFPAMVGLCVVAEPFVLAIFGPKWHSVALLLQILASVGLLQVVGNSVGWIFCSQGRTDIMLAWGAVYTVLTIVGFAIGTLIGSVEAIAISYVVVNLLLFYPELNSAARLVGSNGKEVIAAISGSFICSSLMGVAVAIVQGFLPRAWPPWIVLLVLSISGIIIYGSLVTLTRVGALQDVLNLLAEKRKSRKFALTA